MAADASCIIDPTRECLGLNEAQHLREDMKKIEADVNDLRRKNSDAHERFWDELYALKESNAVHAEQYKQIIEKLTDLQSSVDALEAKPAKRYEDIIKQLVQLLLAAIVGMVIAKIGMGV